MSLQKGLYQKAWPFATNVTTLLAAIQATFLSEHSLTILQTALRKDERAIAREKRTEEPNLPMHWSLIYGKNYQPAQKRRRILAGNMEFQKS